MNKRQKKKREMMHFKKVYKSIHRYGYHFINIDEADTRIKNILIDAAKSYDELFKKVVKTMIDELNQLCGRCKWIAFDRDKLSFYCSNPDSEYSGCYTQYQDSCDEYEVKDYEHCYKAAIDKTGQL